jgi:hypothetical protein
LLAPFGEGAGAAPLGTLLIMIAVFALGIMLSMALFGVAFARAMTAATAARLGQAAPIVKACASIGLGVFWIVSA